MKKFVAIMLILAVAISGLLFVSCKKEEKKVEEKKAPVEEKKVEEKKAPVEKKTAQQLLQEEKELEEKKVEEKALVQDEEWKKFRNNESKYLGSVVTWEIEVGIVGLGRAFGWLGGHSQKEVFILSPIPGMDFNDAASKSGKFPKLHADDWVIITGSFEGVSGDGVVILKPIAIINKGVK